MKKCEACTSCGMPFQDPSDRVYCTHCTREDGTLKPYEEVLEGTTGYFIHSQGIDETAARKMADGLLKKQPAWRNS